MQQRDSKGRFAKAETAAENPYVPGSRNHAEWPVAAVYDWDAFDAAKPQEPLLLTERAYAVAPYLYVLLVAASAWLVLAVIWNQR